MKHRSPLFVAGLPYILVFISYISIYALSFTKESGEKFSSVDASIMLFCLALLIVGIVYVYYWLISTARVLRRSTNDGVPNALLLIVPLANLWWMWRYSQAAETYTQGKQQSALIFILIAALGSIGMGILQDTYNKMSVDSTALKHPDQQSANSNPPRPPA